MGFELAAEAARRGGAGSGGDRLHILPPRLAQMTVDVDESRRDDESGAIDYVGLFRALDRASHTGNLAVSDENVADFVEILRRID